MVGFHLVGVGDPISNRERIDCHPCDRFLSQEDIAGCSRDGIARSALQLGAILHGDAVWSSVDSDDVLELEWSTACVTKDAT